ncbi:MAG: YtxH domain-containing protein [Acidobacteriia bacterium]|nr:YtxH domain-containing protein [Terriglobia bacterium]
MSQDIRSENEDSQESGTSVLAWFLTGAVIGATVAILYAPKSGKETRQFIADTTQRGREAVSEGSKDVMDAGRDLFDRGRKLVEDAADLFDRGRRLVRG